MKSRHLLIFFTVLSLTTMILVDYIIGSKAEFLNAFSVVQRLIGLQATFGYSVVANTLGTAGEFIVVIIVNTVIGTILTLVTRVFKGRDSTESP